MVGKLFVDAQNKKTGSDISDEIQSKGDAMIAVIEKELDIIKRMFTVSHALYAELLRFPYDFIPVRSLKTFF